MKLEFYCRQIQIASEMAGLAKNGQKCLILIAVPQVRKKMREKGKWGKKHENGWVKGKAH